MDIAPPVWHFMSSCTAYTSFIHVNIFDRSFAPIILGSCIVHLTHAIVFLSVFHSSSSLLVTHVQWSHIDVSRSGMYLFMTRNNFAIMKWNNSRFFPNTFVKSSFTSLKYFWESDVTISLSFVPAYDPNKATASMSWSFISIFTRLPLVIVISIPRKSNFLPRCTSKSPKRHFIISMISVTTFEFLCDSLLLSIYQIIVHYSPFMTLFATHLS